MREEELYVLRSGVARTGCGGGLSIHGQSRLKTYMVKVVGTRFRAWKDNGVVCVHC